MTKQNRDPHAFSEGRALNPQAPAAHNVQHLSRATAQVSKDFLREQDWPEGTMPAGQKTLPLTLKGGPFTIFRAEVYGGPYRKAPASIGGVKVVGVKMAEEIDRECDIDVPTEDYKTPHRITFDRGLREAILALMGDMPVYVGCMGGIGRTGLFLAGLAKYFDLSAEHVTPESAWAKEEVTTGAVGYVRKHYLSHALETKQQQEYIGNILVRSIGPKELRKMALRRWFRRGFRA